MPLRLPRDNGPSLMSDIAPYAAQSSNSKGRIFSEPNSAIRNPFDRDRDRIIHCNAFRRLMYKTQVFVNFEGDMYRTRLTHSIEVAQIGRSVARALNLNEPLAEAVCLAHDLGHTPFGHAGQDALNRCMRDYGGFEHNLQSLRVVDKLEKRYAAFDGLNLMFETREGILKHCSKRNARLLGELSERFLKREQPCLEAQIADISDAIAYNHHDIDDGLRAGILTVEGLQEASLFREQTERVKAKYPEIEGRLLQAEIIRGMINGVVLNLIETSRRNITDAKPETIDDVRLASKKLITLSDNVYEQHRELKSYLMKNFYRDDRVVTMNKMAEKVIEDLFDAYMNDVSLLPEKHQKRIQNPSPDTVDEPENHLARKIADYIAGMTDRFAMQEHEHLGISKSY